MKEKLKVEQYDQNSESKQSAGNCQLINLGRRWFNKEQQYGSKL